MHWTPEEEEILAECWLDVTENPKIGTPQSADSFWNTVVDNYNQLADRKRNNDQITGKWAKMSRDIKAFIAAHEEYWRRQAIPFTHYKARQVLRNCPKFCAPEGELPQIDLQRELPQIMFLFNCSLRLLPW
ncbi:uncharacterized protein [Rutidosis leptorrhynchoides]|uniref:uncharacterized protein n=1 Tax=Rutidosis leptorrhynchoides TaxID=125765 RepID=UPI003A995EE0